jgi:quinol monooxygenase YgiN
MITIVAKNSIKQGKVEEFKNLAEKLINESRKEKGNISYNLYQDAKTDNIFTFIEEWENEDIIKSHNGSKHFTSIVPQFANLQAKQSDINLYKKVK